MPRCSAAGELGRGAQRFRSQGLVLAVVSGIWNLEFAPALRRAVDLAWHYQLRDRLRDLLLPPV
jgi:hypothetical protein